MNWRSARPELIMAVILVIVVALAAAAVGGWGGVVVVATAFTFVALLLLRVIMPRSAAQALRVQHGKSKQGARFISGYAQRKFVVAASFTSRAMYESDLRPVLEHILAARLAEKHSVNLYTEPETARRAFCQTRGDERLWQWIDPRQVLGADERASRRRGISSRVLDRLITRLEQL